MTRNDTMIHASNLAPRVRRGNAMVLVAGLLVLLVILSTAFITRTQASRSAGRAHNLRAAREASAEGVGSALAKEISRALFVDPLTGVGTGTVIDANFIRAEPQLLDYQLGSQVSSRYGKDPSYPYNFAPYAVRPFTNLPDEFGETSYPGLWPDGPGVMNPSPFLSHEWNPLGYPGMGDCRWLASFEPLRWAPDDFSDTSTNLPAFKYWRHLTNLARPNNGFRIVRDLIDVTDINNDGTGGLLVNMNVAAEQWPIDVQPDLSRYNNSYARLDTANGADFLSDYRNWLNNDAREFGLAYNQLGGATYRIPHNFIDLSTLNVNQRAAVLRVLADADGDGFTDSYWHLVPGTGQDGTMRVVAVRIVDNSAMVNMNTATQFSPGTDDSPFETADPLYRTAAETPADVALVGEGVTPTSASAAPGDDHWNVGFLDTLARRENVHEAAYGFGDMYYSGPLTAVVGFHATRRFPKFLQEIGAVGSSYEVYDPRTSPFIERDLRVRYWLESGSRPFETSRIFNAFTLASEIELRLFHGQNSPWTYSRLEQSLNSAGQNDTDTFDSPAHSVVRSYPDAYRETSELIHQLNNYELFLDQRHRMTTYNGARTETLPPWLWWRWTWRNGDPGLPKVITDLANSYANGFDIRERFIQQQRLKLDLREANPFYLPTYELDQDTAGLLKLHQRLPYALLNAFSDGDALGRPQYHENLDVHGRVSATTTRIDAGSYFGSYNQGGDTVDDLRELAASYSANILAARDYDRNLFTGDYFLNIAPLYNELGYTTSAGDREWTTGQAGAQPLPDWDRTVPKDWTTRYLGLEKQPFITELFIGHLYAARDYPPLPPNAAPFTPANSNFVDDVSEQTTIVAIQLANPFGSDISIEELQKYGVRIYDRTVWFADIDPSVLEPLYSTARQNHTVVLYMIENADFNGVAAADFKDRWVDFLDLEYQEDGVGLRLHPGQSGAPSANARTVFYDLSQMMTNGTFTPSESPWSTERTTYQEDPPGGGGTGGGGSGVEDDHKIELIRRDFSHPRYRSNPIPANAFDVVVDRITGNGSQTFRERMGQMVEPPEAYREIRDTLVASNSILAGLRVPDTDDTYVAWIRATRAWDDDFDFSPAPPTLPEPGLNVRQRMPRFVIGEEALVTGNRIGAEFDDGSYDPSYSLGDSYNSATDPDDPTDINAPWFTKSYSLRTGTVDRKPTMFDGGQQQVSAFAAQFDAAGNLIGGFNDHPIHDKGFYLRNRIVRPFQMLQRDADFATPGDVLNVWLWSHKLRFASNDEYADYLETEKTFSEFLADEDYVDDRNEYTMGRLGLGEEVGEVVEGETRDPNHAVPLQPAGTRVLDLFACDGPGFNYNPSLDEHVDNPARFFRRNAMGFSGAMTPGVININTAPIEVLQAMPFWYQITHLTAAATNANDRVVEPYLYPRTQVAEALYGYRERVRPPYAESPDDLDERPDELHQDRVIHSLGELLMLDEVGEADALPNDDTAYEYTEYEFLSSMWSIDGPARFGAIANRDWIDESIPTAYQGVSVLTGMEYAGTGNRFSAHVNDYEEEIELGLDDRVSGDLEEATLQVRAASNIATVRSDVFTVYFVVRTFKQDRESGFWDATLPESIVDETRYVMLVDRSEVNSPNDEPKILYLERVP